MAGPGIIGRQESLRLFLLLFPPTESSITARERQIGSLVHTIYIAPRSNSAIFWHMPPDNLAQRRAWRCNPSRVAGAFLVLEMDKLATKLNYIIRASLPASPTSYQATK